jgi:transcriptional regulator with XRE-family HTH domain
MSPVRVRLKELRESRGLTQVQLAEQAGVRRAAISEIESGHRQRIELDMLERLADALEVEPGELIERETVRRKRGAK